MRRFLGVVSLCCLLAGVSSAWGQTATVGGMVFNDLDRDGTLDPEDGPVDVGADGINMSIACFFFPSGLFFPDTTETDVVTGEYQFDVPFFPGDISADCTVGIDPVSQLDPLLEPTTPTSVMLTLVPGQVELGVHFGVSYRDVFLGDLVWLDDDGDGTFDPGDGEAGLGGIAVDAECIDVHGDLMTDSTTTAPDGSYTLSVPCITPVTMDCTVTVDPSAVPGTTPSTPTSQEFLGLLPGDVVEDADFGFEPDAGPTDAILSGTVFQDDDLDGVYTPPEPGIEALDVALDCSFSGGGAHLGSVASLPDGSYEHTVPVPSGESADCTLSTDPEALSSDDPPRYPTTPSQLTVTSVEGGDDVADLDFGYAPCSTCSGGIVELLLTYGGGTAAFVEAYDGDLLFSGMLSPGDSFTVSDGGTPLGTLELRVDGTVDALIATDCTSPVGPGLIAGSFVVERGSSADGGPLCPAPACVNGEVVDFESLPAGTNLDSIHGDLGTGPIGVFAENVAMGPTVNAAVLFDSSAPTGGDDDLGTPNQDFGGPGIGPGGAQGSPFENAVGLGHLLIVAEDLVDVDGDGLIDDPDDAALEGSQLRLDFSTIDAADVDTVSVTGLTVVDIEQSEEPLLVELFDAGGMSIQEFSIDATGCNGVGPIALPRTSGVAEMVVTVRGSGAIDDVTFDCAGPPPEPPQPPTTPPSCRLVGAPELRFEDGRLLWSLTNETDEKIAFEELTVKWPEEQGSIVRIALEDVTLDDQRRLPTSTTVDRWRRDGVIPPGHTRTLSIAWDGKEMSSDPARYELELVTGPECRVTWEPLDVSPTEAPGAQPLR